MEQRLRNKKSFSRKKSERAPSENVLIVCEGEKSEPKYFEAVCRKFNLKSRDIHAVEIKGACGSAPISVVNHALKLKRDRIKDAKKSTVLSEYDSIWVVFDQNGHASVYEAIKKAKNYEFNVAFSKPCFELWYLLHFRQSAKYFENCGKLIRDLEDALGFTHGSYKKSEVPLTDVIENMKTAISNAEWLRKQNSDNTSTDVDILIKYLMEMSRNLGWTI